MRRMLLAAALFGLIAPLTGCPCGDGYASFQADFEYCSGSCDWQLDGTGSVGLVETIHPGEHALRLEGAVAVTSAQGFTLGTGYSDGQWIELVTNCAGPLRLAWDARVSGTVLVVTLPPGSEAPRRPFVSSIATLPPLAGTESYDGRAITAVTVVNSTSVCVVDQIAVMTPAGCY